LKKEVVNTFVHLAGSVGLSDTLILKQKNICSSNTDGITVSDPATITSSQVKNKLSQYRNTNRPAGFTFHMKFLNLLAERTGKTVL
jgi:hypothetical protein